MKKLAKFVYQYNAQCDECNSYKAIYYTVSDFGDAPIIKKCSQCGELYWYTLEDEAYIQPIEKQLVGKHCEKCKAELVSSLVPTHKNIRCCDTEFFLADDFWGHIIPPADEMVQVDVYLIYS